MPFQAQALVTIPYRLGLVVPDAFFARSHLYPLSTLLTAYSHGVYMLHELTDLR